MRYALILSVVLVVPACGDSGGGGGETETETGTTSGPSTSTMTSTEDTGTTGGPGSLEPCDPLAADPCAEGVCAGTQTSGFYCRDACPPTADVGESCGRNGVCLEASPFDDTAACIELTDCDFITGTGCDENCVVVDLSPLRTACVPGGNSGSGAQCNAAGIHECAVGLGCLASDIEDGDPGVCTLWCVPGDPEPIGCVQCIAVTEAIGACAECSVLDQDCPAGSQCHPVNEAFGGICTENGPGGEGDGCSIVEAAQSCQEGLLCIETEVDDVFECVQTCDPGNPMCDDPDKFCNDVGVLNDDLPNGVLGLCLESIGMFCDPEAMPNGCAAGQICLEFAPNFGLCADPCDPSDGDAACIGNYACFPVTGDMLFFDPFSVGNGACGTGCQGDGDCGGDTCLLTDGLESDGVCGTTCTPANPVECAMDETCVPTPNDPMVGACITGGVACDPMVNTSCLGEPTTACVAIDGMPSDGVCMSGCFEQDPLGCGGMAPSCQEKTDAQWQAGACIGQPMACDAIAQTGCDPAETCSILAGGAIGGQATICDDEVGPVPEGGDCSTDDCQAGFACVDDVCRSYCDPQNPDCGAGVCTDISATLYLPADTIGVCM